MPRPLEVALEVDGVVPECGLRLALRGLNRFVELVARADDAHAAAATAGGGLDDQGRLVGRGNRRYAGFLGDPLRRELVPTGAPSLPRRAHPDQPCGPHPLGEVAVLSDAAV